MPDFFFCEAEHFCSNKQYPRKNQLNFLILRGFHFFDFSSCGMLSVIILVIVFATFFNPISVIIRPDFLVVIGVFLTSRSKTLPPCLFPFAILCVFSCSSARLHRPLGAAHCEPYSLVCFGV